jgi:type VI secretion system secreted protein VgrG
MRDEHFILALPRLAADLQVTGATGTEAMNALYRFDVHALVAADRGFARRAIETPATLSMRFDGAAVRAVHGIVGACQATGQEEAGKPVFLLRIVPRAARLRLRRTSRIFQDMTTREIVEEVLAVSRVLNRWELASPLPKRTYCVQYDETDYDFVARLCADDGIFFSFDHPLGDAGTEEVLVFADTAASYAPLQGLFRFRPTVTAGAAMKVEEGHIQAFALRHAMTTKRVLLRSFDFEKPPIPRRDAAGLDGALHADELGAMHGFVDGSATVYDHQQAREQALLEPIAAQTALEAETAGAAMVEAETAGRRMIPGRRFRLAEHTLSELDGEYVVTSCSHECRSPQWAGSQPMYTNRFTAAPASVPYRAERSMRRVRQSIETATVVGPDGEEIHTDQFGRVKVQFHWDLQGRFDERSSAWLRVAQAWAGAGYGAQFLPRVGHEVLVGYIDDDADRPVVLGSLHNGLNQTPFTFPRDKTMSGIKTWTSPNGQGGHELIFEDKAGSEIVTLRSNRTLALSGAEDSSLTAERDLRITAGQDRSDEVIRDASTRIGGDEMRRTEGSRSTDVGVDEKLAVLGNRASSVTGHESLRVGQYETRVVCGHRTTVIGATQGEPGSDQLSVSGRYSAASVEEMRFASEREIELVCGQSKIILRPDHIVLDSPTIQLQASDHIALLQGGGASLLTLEGGAAAMGGGTASVFGGGRPPSPPARLFLDTEAHLDGVLVKLNCGPMGGGSGTPITETDEKGVATFTVLRQGFAKNVDAVTLVIATPSGEIVERQCPVGGSVTLEGRTGEVFTVVETRIGDTPVPVAKKQPGEA